MAQDTDNNLIASLTDEDKVRLQTGYGIWNTFPVNKSGIKSVTVSDGPLGLRKEADGNALNSVAFPSAAKMACGFDVDALRSYGAAVGEQCRSENVNFVLGPAVNIKRDPRCGRNFEYFSEDPFLTAKLAEAYIDGLTSQGVGACVKHFAANNQEYGRLVCDSVIDDRALREIYLSAFERVVKHSDPCAIMCSYNKLNGEYCSQNKWLLTDVLRGEWGYKGLVMSDWGATDDRVKGIKAGLDLEMPQGDFDRVSEALANGDLDKDSLDTVVRRVIDFSGKFGDLSARSADIEQQRKLARKMSAECTVLVKNNCKLLPLAKTDKIAVVGALAKTPVYQGGGSSAVNAVKVDSLVDALTQANTDFVYSAGYNVDGTADESLIEQAIDVVQKCDKVILVVGDKPDCEGYDRANWCLPENQLAVIDAVTSANSNVVLVLQCGSSVDTSFSYSVKAMLIDYYGGECGGQALFDVIFGDVAPQGRLAETWYTYLPKTCADFDKDYHRTLYKESIFVGYRYAYSANVQTAFPFGYGLSYSAFKWDTPVIDCIDKSQITVKITVKNTGEYTDSDVVQVYVTNADCRDFIERKKLVGFVKVRLSPKEKKTVSVNVPIEELSHYDIEQGKFIVNGGKYILTVGKDVCDDRFKLEYAVNADNLTRDRSDEASCYYNLDEDFCPSDKEFLQLYGKPLAEIHAAVSVSTPLNDIGNGFAAKIVKSRLTRNLNDNDKRYAFAQPLRAFVSPYLSRDMLYTIVDILNGALFKNLWKLLRQRAACKKALKKKQKNETEKS